MRSVWMALPFSLIAVSAAVLPQTGDHGERV
jgi:hypothetical protein